ncbi:mannose/glucose-specific lectin-like [Triticum aestivum]|uniref:mannose/glucose-specific lectin-like n=1 Tax=Triticum aestivum TaxID=4565 RepID=UPI001D0055D5|nr:mannose/glucose-specific lectin-like [Triticum aestivum]
MADPVKVGPWGAAGQGRDINVGSRPQRLNTITIGWEPSWGYGNGRIIGISFVYVDQNDKEITVGPWGKIDREHSRAIQIDQDEKLYVVSGTFNDAGVTSLMLKTNKTEHGPFGHAAGSAFSVPLKQAQDDGEVVGEVVAFFCRSNDTLQALGVYVLGENGLPVMIGPWGGIVNQRISTPVQLKSVTVYSTQRIDGFSFTYVDQNGDDIPVGTWGTTNGQKNTFSLNEGEYVKDMTGTFDLDGVTSLKFTTNREHVHGLYGRLSGTDFRVPLPDNAVVGNDGNHNGGVLGFFGGSGGNSLPNYLAVQGDVAAELVVSHG